MKSVKSKTKTYNTNLFKSFKKKKYKKKYPKKTAKDKKQDKLITKLSKRLDSLSGTLVYRYSDMERFYNIVGFCNYLWLPLCDQAGINLVLQELRYYDPTAPANMVQADGATGNYMKKFLFKKNRLDLVLRSNYNIDTDIQVYRCKAKSDFDGSPIWCMQNGTTNWTNAVYNDINLYPSDVKLVTDLWNLKRIKNKVLEAGRQIKLSIFAPEFDYEPQITLQNNVNYNKRWNSEGILIRISGVPTHDSILVTEFATGIGKLDVQNTYSHVVEYDAGGDIDYLYANTNYPNNFTNVGYSGLRPVSGQSTVY